MNAGPPLRAARALVALALLAVACAPLLRVDSPEKRSFVLSPGRPAAIAGVGTGILRVGVVRASPVAQNRGFVYLRSDGAVETDYYHEFFAPPGALVRDALIDWLRASGRFAEVVRGSEARPDWLLETHLDRIAIDLTNPDASQVALDLEVRLLDVRAGAADLVFARRFAEREPANADTPAAYVEAWSRALERVLAAVALEVGDAIARAPVRR